MGEALKISQKEQSIEERQKLDLLSSGLGESPGYSAGCLKGLRLTFRGRFRGHVSPFKFRRNVNLRYTLYDPV